MNVIRLWKPTCVLVYALAPADATCAQANRKFNEFVADKRLPLALFHDHFIGQPGGVAIFFLETFEEQDELAKCSLLDGWQVEIRPFTLSYNPSAFDDQIAYTLRQYRGLNWEQLHGRERLSSANFTREPAHDLDEWRA